MIIWKLVMKKQFPEEFLAFHTCRYCKSDLIHSLYYQILCSSNTQFVSILVFWHSFIVARKIPLVNQLSVTVTNTWDNQLIKWKDLFWFVTLEVSVLGQLALLLLSLWQSSTSWQGKCGEAKLSPHSQDMEREKKERTGVPLSLSRIYPQ